jgi:hypothetical protein
MTFERRSIVRSGSAGIFILAAWSTLVAAQAPPASSIHGRVTDPEGRPIATADVSLLKFGSDAIAVERWVAVTNEAGEFAFDGLAAGWYSVTAAKAGYATRRVQANGAADIGHEVRIGSREHIRDAVVVLPRAGSVKGRILDAAGQPAVGALVTPQIRRNGRLVDVLQPSQANSAGEYEIAGLPEGEYFIVTTTRFTSAVEIPGRGPAQYASTWYPGTTDDRTAVTVAIRPGEEASGIDVRMLTLPVVSLSGVVTVPDGRLPRGTAITYVQRRPGGGWLRGTHLRLGPGGSFTVETLTPGPLTLIARAEAGGRRLVDVVTLNLAAPTEGVRMVLGPGARVRGRLVFEGEPPPMTRPLVLAITLPGVPPDIYARDEIVTIDPEGTFEMDGLFGERALEVIDLPPGWVILSTTLNGTAHSGSTVTFERGRDVEAVLQVGRDR